MTNSAQQSNQCPLTLTVAFDKLSDEARRAVLECPAARFIAAYKKAATSAAEIPPEESPLPTCAPEAYVKPTE